MREKNLPGHLARHARDGDTFRGRNMSFYGSGNDWNRALLFHPVEEPKEEVAIANTSEIEALRNEGVHCPESFDMVLSILKLFIMGRMMNPIFIIGGEPSCGKSSTIRAIVKVLKMDDFFFNGLGLSDERPLSERNAPELHAFLKKRGPRRKLLVGY